MTELRQLYKDFFGQEPARVTLLGGAASNRRYFRMFHSADPDSGAVVGVIGENQKENHAFISLARHMYDKGVHVPRIFNVSADEMRYIQQDFGRISLYDVICQEGNDSPATQELLRRVMRDLPKIQFESARDFDFRTDGFREPRFCGTTIRWDLNYFKYCFLKLTGYPMDELKLEADFEKLTTALLDCTDEDEKWAFLYRDFQSRNVMIDGLEPGWTSDQLASATPGYIDFQGGYEGPVYYDVAAFLWQTRANYPAELRQELMTDYVDALQEYLPISLRVFRHRLRVFVFFRLLQTLGTYGYRGLYEHKAMFLTPIRQALQSLVNLTHKDSEPAFRNCSLRPGQNAMLQALFGDAFADTNWGPDDSAGCAVSDDGYAEDTQPAIDRFEIEEDCPYLCQLLNEVAEMEMFKPQPAIGRLTVRITSFSYKRGLPEDYSGNGGGFVFDCRAPLNPGRFPYYKKLTGLDAEVIDFLEGRRDEKGELLPVNPEACPTSMQRYVENVYALVDPAVETYLERGFTSLVINCGCTGGQHRSVYCAQHLAEHLQQKYPAAIICLSHREQHVTQTYNA